MAGGRRKNFDELDVLERAMNLFWLKGYGGAGLSELLAEMGISRQSLYDTFGSKRGLFIRAVEFYRDNHLVDALQLLESGEPPLARVRSVAEFFERLASDSRCRGCFVANALVELGPHDEEVAKLLEETLVLLQQAVERALREAAERGELKPGKQPRELGMAFTNALIGMAVTGRLPLAHASMSDIFSGTLQMLS